MEVVATVASTNGCQSSKSSQLVDEDTSESSLTSSSTSNNTRSSTRRKSSLKDPATTKTPNSSKLRSLNNVKFEKIEPVANTTSASAGLVVEEGEESQVMLNGNSVVNGEHIEDENRPIIRASSRQRQTINKKNNNKLENVTSTLENQDNTSCVKTAGVQRRMSLKSPARKRQKSAVFCPNDENTLDCFGIAKPEVVVNNTSTNNIINTSKTTKTNGDLKPSSVVAALNGTNGGSTGPSTPEINVVDIPSNDDNSRFTNNDTTSLDEDSQQMQTQPEGTTVNGHESNIKPKKTRKKRMSNYGLYNQIDGCVTSVSQLFIYKWPLKEDLPADGSECQDTYILQEQISELIGVKSFKRKYPDLFRRLIDIKERVYLQENKVVTETQCDLGLTALRLNDVLDILADQYPDRYTELTDYLAKKRHIELANAQLANVSEEPQATAATSEPVKTGRFGRAILSEAERLKEMTKKAIKSAISYNQNLLKERKTERRSYFDLQTMRIQQKRPSFPVTFKSGYPNGPYPVALLNGQYQHYYKRYTPDELRNLPVNTVLYTAETPLPLLYDEWKMKQQNPSKSYRTFKKVDSSDDEYEPYNQVNEPTTTTFDTPAQISSTKVNHQTHTQPTKSSPLVINANLLSQHLASQQHTQQHTASSSHAFRMTVSAAPTVANLISQKLQSNQNSQPIFKPCYVCSKSSQINVPNASASNTDQFMIHCRSCDRYSHPTCLELNPSLVKWQAILEYHWQCMDCKKCSACQDPHDEEKMMFCDRCDRGFHTYCVGLSEVPSGSFFCKNCEKPDSLNANHAAVVVTPARVVEKLKTNEKIGEKTVTPKERTGTGKRGRPLGSLNKPKDPNSPKKQLKKVKKLNHSLNYSTYGELSQSINDTNSNTMPFVSHTEASQDDQNSRSYLHDDQSQSLSYDNFKNIININLSAENLIQSMY